jgi:hypothetical protein
VGENDVMLQQLRSAIFDDGMFAITSFDESNPSGEEKGPFGGVLQAFASCAMEGHLEGHMNKARQSDDDLHAPTDPHACLRSGQQRNLKGT